MQKMTASLQVVDPITEQHTATLKSPGFSNLYTRVMNFMNNVSIGCGPKRNPNLKIFNEKDKATFEGFRIFYIKDTG